MKKIKMMLISISLLLGVSCQDAEMMAMGEEGQGQDCGNSSKVVKKVKDQVGRLEYNEFLKRYTITASMPNTYDSQDVGLLCALPKNLDISRMGEAGLRVVFNGKYRESNKVSPIAGTNYYYLEIQKIKTK